MINESNYSLASKGEFKTLPRKCLETVMTMDKTIVLNGRVWTLNHVSESYDRWYEYKKVSSIYYISEDRKWLIRASDHWCTSKPCTRKNRTFICEKINFCKWSLDKGGQTVSAYGRVWQAGIIRFSDLKCN